MMSQPMPSNEENQSEAILYFLRKEQPSVNLALPPVGWHRTVVQPWQMTTVWACEKTVVIVKQPGHLTSMKKERGPGTRVCGARLVSIPGCESPGSEVETYLELVLLGLSSRAGVEKVNGENLIRKFYQHNSPSHELKHFQDPNPPSRPFNHQVQSPVIAAVYIELYR